MGWSEFSKGNGNNLISINNRHFFVYLKKFENE
jgi:hypothetical protein